MIKAVVKISLEGPSKSSRPGRRKALSFTGAPLVLIGVVAGFLAPSVGAFYYVSSSREDYHGLSEYATAVND